MWMSWQLLVSNGMMQAKELDDGTVLVKFPADDRGEDILKLVQRLLGDKININV